MHRSALLKEDMQCWHEERECKGQAEMVGDDLLWRHKREAERRNPISTGLENQAPCLYKHL